MNVDCTVVYSHFMFTQMKIHLISSHLISSHLISSHLISSHLISSISSLIFFYCLFFSHHLFSHLVALSLFLHLHHLILSSCLASFSHLISTSISITSFYLPFSLSFNSCLCTYAQFMHTNLNLSLFILFSTYTKILRVLAAVCNLPCLCVLPQASERHALLTRWEKPLICLLCMLISGPQSCSLALSLNPCSLCVIWSIWRAPLSRLKQTRPVQSVSITLKLWIYTF